MDFYNCGSSFTDGTSDEFSTVYSGTTTSSAYKIGDATYETSGWNDDTATFIYPIGPFFCRGGAYSGGSGAGIFHFNAGGGVSASNISFRMCLAVQ